MVSDIKHEAGVAPAAADGGAAPRMESIGLDALLRATPETFATPPSVPPDTAPGAQRAALPAAPHPTAAYPIKRAQSLQYPFRCIGRIDKKLPGTSSWQHAGSGVLVGPWHVLTASHVLNGDAAGTSYKFTPAYFLGPRPNEIKVRWYESEIVGTLGISIDEVSGYDYLVCELERPLGLEWSWMGTEWSGSKGFYTNIIRTSIGYPGDLEDGDQPFGNLFTITDVKNAGHNSLEIIGQGDVAEGWSGGPLYGPMPWTGSVVVGVLSGESDKQGPDDVSFAGGEEMVRLVLHGHNTWKKAERFNAIWVPSNELWKAHYGVPRAYFDGLNATWQAKGYKLTRVNGYFLANGELRLNGIWVKSTEQWDHVYGWAPEHFHPVFAQRKAQGYRPFDLNAMVAPNGQILYNATWVKRAVDWTAITGYTREHFDGADKQLLAQGYRYEELNAFVLPDQSLRYNAVYVKNNQDRKRIHGWAPEHFDGLHATYQSQGYRLSRVNSTASANGAELMNAIWIRTAEHWPEVSGWAFEHFAGTHADFEAQGYQPIDINAFVLP